MRSGFAKTVSALCYSIVQDESQRLSASSRCAVSTNAVVNFVLAQQSRMPDYLQFPLLVLTLVFSLAGFRYGGALFHRLDPAARRRQIAAWRNSRSRIARDFLRLHDSLAIFCWTSLLTQDEALEPAPILVRARVAVDERVLVNTGSVVLGQPAT